MATEYKPEEMEILEGIQAVRRRPAMYFDCFEIGSLDSLAFEVACHAFDEYFDGNCAELRLAVSSSEASLWYDAGMSLRPSLEGITEAEAMMTLLYACSNLKKHLEVGEKYCRAGMASINSAAEKCTVTTIWEGQKATFEFEDGETKFKNIEPYLGDESWTEIYLKPSPSVFGNLRFTSAGIAERVDLLRTQLENLSFIVEDRIREGE